jgi:hypothetical protein
VTTSSGETKQLCRLWDGTDVALVDGSGNQMVAGTLTCNAGTGTFTVSGTVTANQGGTWTVQPGNTANTTAWLVTGAGGTFPVTVASLPLPSGASTSAKQPSLGTAGTPSSDVLTVQGVASMTALKVDGSGVTQPVSGTVTASGPLTDAQLRATAVPVSGTVTASGPLTDTQLRATAVPVSGPLTDAQLRATAVPVSGTVTASGPLTDTQLRATALPVSGTVTVTDGAGALNVIVDSATLGTVTVAGTVTTTPPSNASENLAQVAGSTASTAATGVLKVGAVGNAGAAFDAANAATAPANVVAVGVEVQSSALGTSATAGQVRRPVAGLDGVLYMRPGSPLLWSCGVTAIGATLTQCQAAPAASTSLYLTDITVVSDTATAGSYTLRFGTGTNCATGTTTVFPAVSSITTGKIPYPGNTANLPIWHSFQTPLKLTAANALCVICVATNTCTVSAQGFTAP